MTTNDGSNGYTTYTLTFSITKSDSVDVQCGLCNRIDCFQSPLHATVISSLVQLISLVSKYYNISPLI